MRYRTKMQFVNVKNAAGKYVRVSTEGVTDAAANVKNMPADYRVSITNGPGENTYPISSFTWLLIPEKSTDPAKAKVLAEFLAWMLNHGEAEAPILSYASLPVSSRPGCGRAFNRSTRLNTFVVSQDCFLLQLDTRYLTSHQTMQRFRAIS